MAIGGSRRRVGAAGIDGLTTSTAIRIIGVPWLSARRESCPLFVMDAEYAGFAASALRKRLQDVTGQKNNDSSRLSVHLMILLTSNPVPESINLPVRYLLKKYTYKLDS